MKLAAMGGQSSCRSEGTPPIGLSSTSDYIGGIFGKRGIADDISAQGWALSQ